MKSLNEARRFAHGRPHGRAIPRRLCPKDGGTMLIATIGGRTTYWCSVHQR